MAGFHIVASGEFPIDSAVLRLADYTLMWIVSALATIQFFSKVPAASTVNMTDWECNGAVIVGKLC